jgi:hypothetical protein
MPVAAVVTKGREGGFYFVCASGGIAQLGERLHGMQEVIGSIPFTSTNRRGRSCCSCSCSGSPGSPSSRGLGHHPFTVSTGVRIPVGTPAAVAGRCSSCSSKAVHCLTRGGIAQLGERLHGMQEVSGSIPLTSTTADKAVEKAAKQQQNSSNGSPRSPSSRGLGHHPFTVSTGVRIPVGTPKLQTSSEQQTMQHIAKPRFAAFVVYVPFSRHAPFFRRASFPRGSHLQRATWRTARPNAIACATATEPA